MDYKLNENKLNKLEEFFNCIQENKNSRSCVFILLFRRLIFIILLVNLESIPSRYVIGILIFLQICYVSWVAFVRPYKEVKENLISILNEAYFSLLLVVLILFNTQEDWNQVKINITMWILMSNSIAIFVIVIVYTIKSIFSCLMHKWHRRTNDNEQTAIVAPLPQIISAIATNKMLVQSRNTFKNQSSSIKHNKKEENKYQMNDDLSQIRFLNKRINF